MVHLSRFRPKTLRVVGHKNILLSDQACTGPETLRVIFPIRLRICATKLFVGSVMRLICTPVTWCHAKICVFVSTALCSICSLLNPNGLDLIWSVIHGSHLGVNPAHVCNLFTVLGLIHRFSTPLPCHPQLYLISGATLFVQFCFKDLKSSPKTVQNSSLGKDLFLNGNKSFFTVIVMSLHKFHFHPLKV